MKYERFIFGGTLIVDVFSDPPGLVQVRVNTPEAIGYPAKLIADDAAKIASLVAANELRVMHKPTPGAE